MKRISKSPRLRKAIEQQFQKNQSSNLLYGDLEQIMTVDAEFLAVLEELAADRGERSVQAANRLLPDVSATFLQRVQAINPYLHIAPENIDELRQIYARTFIRMRESGDVLATLKEYHYPQLSHWLAQLYPEDFQAPLKNARSLGKLTYGEYPAEFQMAVLQIDVNTLRSLRPPVLDIGCGSHANLARHLSALGVSVYGIDRHLEIQLPYLQQADWFEFPFDPGAWGSIISNMAFSNHLQYALRYDPERLPAYLEKAGEVYASLAPGGRFYCAPSLPFLEERLDPQRYEVLRYQQENGVFTSVIRRTR